MGAATGAPVVCQNITFYYDIHLIVCTDIALRFARLHKKTESGEMSIFIDCLSKIASLSKFMVAAKQKSNYGLWIS